MTLVLSEKMNGFLSGLSFPKNAVQEKAIERLKALDFPTTRNEYWKYTRVGKIANTDFNNTPAPSETLNLTDHLVADNYIVIENGVIREELSSVGADFSIKYLTADQMEETQVFTRDDVFSTLNAGLFSQAISIEIAPNQQIDNPIQLLFISTGEKVMSNNRILINAGKSSNSTVVFSSLTQGGTACFSNVITQARVAENAHLTIHKIQNEGESNRQISTDEIYQANNSTFKINTFTLGGLLMRNNINIAVDGENCETHMNGAIVSKGKQHIDNHTFVDHKVPNCYSNENYKYVLDENSTGVFNGRVVVQQDAQVINAYQNNGNILLSDTASINSKPELEIYADDVKCSHGSTTGQLDESALFYLQTRGISKENARKILVSAFIGEIIETVAHEKSKLLTESILSDKFGWNFD